MMTTRLSTTTPSRQSGRIEASVVEVLGYALHNFLPMAHHRLKQLQSTGIYFHALHRTREDRVALPAYLELNGPYACGSFSYALSRICNSVREKLVPYWD